MIIKLITPCWHEKGNKDKTKYLKDWGKASAQMKNPIRYQNKDLVMYDGEPMTRSKANSKHKRLMNENGEVSDRSTYNDMIKFTKSLGYRRIYPAIEKYGKHEFIKMFKESEFNSKKEVV